MKKVSTFMFCVVASILVQAATAPNASAAILGTAGAFGVLAGQTVTCTGATNITGDVGVSPGSSITGFPVPCNDIGTIYGPGPVTVQAQSDLTSAYNALAGLAPDSVLTGVDLGGQTLTSGVYFFASAAQLTGTLTLDALGSTNASWVFQIGSTLTTASASSVVFTNGSGSVYWQVGSSATLGSTTSFVGNIAALTSITLVNGANINCGSALARNGGVTLDNNQISIGCDLLAYGPGGEVIVPGDNGGGGGGGTPVPEPGTLALLGTGIAGLIARRRRSVQGPQRDLALQA